MSSVPPSMLRPLVVAAELHVAAVVLEQIVEVVGLHDHVVEFQEAESALHALLVALRAEHVVDREACADVPQKLHIVELQQPVGIVDHDGLARPKVNKPLHLLFEAVAVVLDGLDRQHLTHIAASGGVADHAGAAADQNDRAVAGHLQALHEAQRHKVADVQGVRGRVEADIESGLAVVDHFPDLVLVCDLRDEAARLQFFINSHIDDLLYFSGEFHLKSPLLV
jgi:hypothetical protein